MTYRKPEASALFCELAVDSLFHAYLTRNRARGNGTLNPPRSAPEIQSTSLELNVRGWTPGVEPCAETKSSRHCHLGRDARVFTPAGKFPFYVSSFPAFCPVFPPVLVAKRLPMSIPRGPLFGLFGRRIREQRGYFPTNLSSLSSFAFEKNRRAQGGENNTVKVPLCAR